MEKMSKSGAENPNIQEIPIEVKLSAMENEKNYWKGKYETLLGSFVHMPVSGGEGIVEEIKRLGIKPTGPALLSEVGE